MTQSSKYPKRLFIKTYGCQMNEHDSEKIAGLMGGEGYVRVDLADQADLIVMNTCDIRDNAAHKAFSDLGRYEILKKKNPSLKIAFGGCLAQQKGEGLVKTHPAVNVVFWSKTIGDLPVLCARADLEGHAWDLEDRIDINAPSLPSERSDRHTAWVSIMEGCDNHCSFCVVPYTRGAERSRPSGEILREVEGLAQRGRVEVTLLGQTVNSYGKGLKNDLDFPDLLRAVGAVPGIRRVRFLTSHPKDLSPELIAAMAEVPQVCPHLHLPMQSGSDRILEQMLRGYTSGDYRSKVERLRDAVPGIAITTDIIVGFPGESKADFTHTLNILAELRFDGIFAFKYSRRPNTPAATLPDPTPETEKDARLQELFALQRTISREENRRLIGESVEVLVEAVSKSDAGRLSGRTGTNRVVHFAGGADRVGSFVPVRITDAGIASLQGQMAEVPVG